MDADSISLCAYLSYLVSYAYEYKAKTRSRLKLRTFNNHVLIVLIIHSFHKREPAAKSPFSPKHSLLAPAMKLSQ